MANFVPRDELRLCPPYYRSPPEGPERGALPRRNTPPTGSSPRVENRLRWHG